MSMVVPKLACSLILTVLLQPGLASASPEHKVTVLTRTGDRVAGLLEDVEGGVTYVRVSQHDQRRLNIGDVALLDFVGGASGLPDTELVVARGPQHLVLLRDGSSWTGRFIDVRGGEATAAAGENHTLYFRMSNGEERHIALDAVSRIYLGNFPGGTTVANKSPTFTSGEPLPAGAIRVPGNVTWTATPLSVRRGDQVRFNVSGQNSIVGRPRGRRARCRFLASALREGLAASTELRRCSHCEDRQLRAVPNRQQHRAGDDAGRGPAVSRHQRR